MLCTGNWFYWSSPLHCFLSDQIQSSLVPLSNARMYCLLYTVFIMGAYTGAISLIVNIIRNVLLLKSNVWKWAKSKNTLYFILLLLTLMTAYTWAGWISLLPFVSVAVTTIGYWTHNGQKIRLSQLVGSPCTLTYDLIIRSWGGAMSEGIAIVSILISIYRFGWKNLAAENS